MPVLGADFALRVASALLLIGLALLGAWLGGWTAALLIAAATAVVHVEWIGLTDAGHPAVGILTVTIVIAIAAAAAGFPVTGLVLVAAAMVAAVITGSVWRALGVLYAAALGFSLLMLRGAPEDGFEAIIVLFAVVWATDTGAYAAGRLVGGAKLWPRLSPKKTWAGAAGGLVAGIVAGLAAAAALGLQVGGRTALLSGALSVAAQAGDLFESWIKRRAGAKDSGRLIPGHGGLMDRVDSLVFAAAVAGIVGWFGGGAGHLAAGLVRW